MAFTVSMPGGARDYEFEAYIRLLEKVGVNVASSPRVVDPVTRQRWLSAWADETVAQKFAVDLRVATENDKWKVYSVPDQDLTQGPLGPLDILVVRRSDGCIYSLSPISRKLIQKSFPRANLAQNVFVSTTISTDFESTQGPIWDHVAFILTGLSDQQIKQLGGFRVIDPQEKRVFHNSPLLARLLSALG